MLSYDIDYFGKYRQRSRFLRLSHGKRPWYYSGWKRTLKRIVKGNQPILLEVGCGLGMGAPYWAELGKIILMDLSEYAVREAQGLRRGDFWLIGDAEALGIKDSSLSAVIALDVIEHLQCPERFVAEAFRVLRPGGILALTTPNPDSFGARRKGKRWFGWKDETHINIRSRGEWKNLLEKNNFEILIEGSSSLWDLPYWQHVPSILQKILLIPCNILVDSFYGPILPWELGENSMFLAKVKK